MDDRGRYNTLKLVLLLLTLSAVHIANAAEICNVQVLQNIHYYHCTNGLRGVGTSLDEYRLYRFKNVQGNNSVNVLSLQHQAVTYHRGSDGRSLISRNLGDDTIHRTNKGLSSVTSSHRGLTYTKFSDFSAWVTQRIGTNTVVGTLSSRGSAKALEAILMSGRY